MEFLIASYPRSGNTYLRILLRNRYGLVSSPVPSRRPASQTIPDSGFFQPYHRDEKAVVGIEGIKTHTPPIPGDTRQAIYIVRDGRDVLVSYAHYALSFIYNCPSDGVTTERLRETLRDLILEKQSPFKTWSENVDAWLVRPNTHIVRFEELIAEPGRVADRVIAKLGLALPIRTEAIPTFGELKSSDPRFFRRGGKGEWQELFTPELRNLFWKHNGATMVHLGYGEAPLSKAA